MATTQPRYLGQYITQQLGYTGPFDEGGAVQYRNQHPEIAAQYAALMKKYGNGGNPLLSSIGGPPDLTSYNSGVVPVGQIEPFNQYQREALTSLAQPNAAGDPYYNIAQQLFGQASPALQSGMAPLTADKYAAGVMDYMNPWNQQVLDRSVSRINEQAAQTRARLMGSRKPGSLSFGDTSQGVQLGQLDKNTMGQIADTSAQLNQQGFNTASDNFMNAFTGNRNAQFQGAGAFAGLAGLASGFGDLMRGNNMEDILNKLKSGTAIQGQNQQLLDVVRNQIGQVQGSPQNNLTWLASILGQVPNGQSIQAPQQSPLSQIGGAGTFLGSQWGGLFGSGSDLDQSISRNTGGIFS